MYKIKVGEKYLCLSPSHLTEDIKQAYTVDTFQRASRLGHFAETEFNEQITILEFSGGKIVSEFEVN